MRGYLITGLSNVDVLSTDNLTSEILDFANVERNYSRFSRVQGIIFTASDIFTRMLFGATLTDNDLTWFSGLSSINLDTESFGYGISS